METRTFNMEVVNGVNMAAKSGLFTTRIKLIKKKQIQYDKVLMQHSVTTAPVTDSDKNNSKGKEGRKEAVWWAKIIITRSNFGNVKKSKCIRRLFNT